MTEKSRTFYEDGQVALESALQGIIALHPGLQLHKSQKGSLPD